MARLLVNRLVGGRSACNNTHDCEPRHASHERNIEKTARVVLVKINRLTGEDGAYAIKQCRFEKLPVDCVPSPVAALPNQTYSHHQNYLVAGVEDLEAVAIRVFIRRNILLGDHNKEIQV